MLAFQSLLSAICLSIAVNVAAYPLGMTTSTSIASPPTIALNTSTAIISSSPSNSTVSAIMPLNLTREPLLDPVFHISIHPTCHGTQALQLQRALDELHRLVSNATNELLQSATSDISQLYWGPSGKADLSTPIGVFHQLLYGSKEGVEIRCEDEAKQCKDGKTLRAGGYIDDDNGSIHLCSDIFSSKNQRRFIEEICNEDWTLSDNQPHQYWSAVLLNLFLQSKHIIPNSLLNSAAWAYPNVLHVARLDPIASSHNINTYLYFVLDHFAQQHIDGGCRGVLHANLVKDPQIAVAGSMM